MNIILHVFYVSHDITCTITMFFILMFYNDYAHKCPSENSFTNLFGNLNFKAI